MMKELLNKEVNHKKFGVGKVIQIEGDFFWVSFEDMERKFSFPEVFDKHLSLNDKALAKKIKALIEIKEQDKREIKLLEEEKRMTNVRRNEYLDLVETYEDVVKNAKVFCDNVNDCEELRSKLSNFQHWYYIEEIDKFAPSKFIGYQDNTVEDYIFGTSSQGYMDGRETEKQLNKWFKQTPEEVKNYYYHKLLGDLSWNSKEPNKRACVHIKKDF